MFAVKKHTKQRKLYIFQKVKSFSVVNHVRRNGETKNLLVQNMQIGKVADIPIEVC